MVVKIPFILVHHQTVIVWLARMISEWKHETLNEWIRRHVFSCYKNVANIVFIWFNIASKCFKRLVHIIKSCTNNDIKYPKNCLWWLILKGVENDSKHVRCCLLILFVVIFCTLQLIIIDQDKFRWKNNKSKYIIYLILIKIKGV